MASPHQVRAGAARTVLLSALVVLVVCAVAAPAGAQRHSVRAERRTTCPSACPGASRHSICSRDRRPRLASARSLESTARSSPARPGAPLAWPDQTGLSIRYKFRGGAAGVWSGAGRPLGACRLGRPHRRDSTTTSSRCSIPSPASRCRSPTPTPSTRRWRSQGRWSSGTTAAAALRTSTRAASIARPGKPRATCSPSAWRLTHRRIQPSATASSSGRTSAAATGTSMPTI